MVFPVSHVDVRVGPTWKLSTKGLMLLNCGAGEDSWESLGLQRDPTSPSKGDQPWVFTGKTDAKAPVLWPPDSKNWLFGKDPDSGKDWRQEEKGTTEGEMVGWHHRLDGHELGRIPGDGDGQGGLVCCSPWCRKESDMTEWLNTSSLDCSRQAPPSMGFPGKNTGVGCHFLLQGILSTQGLTPCLSCLLHWQAHSFPLSPDRYWDPVWEAAKTLHMDGGDSGLDSRMSLMPQNRTWWRLVKTVTCKLHVLLPLKEVPKNDAGGKVL